MPDPWHFLSLFPVFLIFDLFKNHVFWPIFGQFLVHFLDHFFSNFWTQTDKNIRRLTANLAGHLFKNEVKNDHFLDHFLAKKGVIFWPPKTRILTFLAKKSHFLVWGGPKTRKKPDFLVNLVKKRLFSGLKKRVIFQKYKKCTFKNPKKAKSWANALGYFGQH